MGVGSPLNFYDWINYLNQDKYSKVLYHDYLLTYALFDPENHGPITYEHPER